MSIGHLEREIYSKFIEQKGESVQVDIFPSINEALDEYFSDSDSGENSPRSEPIVISGPSGVGKSALISKWLKQRSNLDFVFSHIAGGASSGRSVQVGHFLRCLMQCLTDHFNLNKQYNDTSTNIDDCCDEQLPWIFPRVLDAASKRTKNKIIIVLDGLHRMNNCPLATACNPSANSNLHWLPINFPSNVKVILTTTSPSIYDDPIFGNEVLEKKLEVRESRKKKVLMEMRRRSWKILELNNSTLSMQDEYLLKIVDLYCSKARCSSTLATHALLLLPITKRAIIDHVQADNMQFLNVILSGVWYACNKNFDIFGCIEEWTKEDFNIGDLYNSILTTLENGNKPTRQKQERASKMRDDVGHESCQSNCVERKGRVAFINSLEASDSKSLENLIRLRAQQDVEYSIQSSSGSSCCSDQSNLSFNNIDDEVRSQQLKGDVPVYLNGGENVEGLGKSLGDALALLYTCRHGLRVQELIDMLVLKGKLELWLKDIACIPQAESKLIDTIVKQKSRLIDVFRSFDLDQDGILSYEEFCSGLKKLGIDDQKEVNEILAYVDKNKDGNICFDEVLKRYDAKTKKAHASSGDIDQKRICVGSKLVSHRNSILKTYTFTINPKMAATLVSALLSLGIMFINTNQNNDILVFSSQHDALRDVVWQRYIKTKVNEEELHAIIASYFIEQVPSVRRCEELPWHLLKCRRWITLKNILMDLRTFDIMYNKDNLLKRELLEWLSILKGDNKENQIFNKKQKPDNSPPSVLPSFDIVDELNHAVEIWYQGTSPHSDILASMIVNIGEFLIWFSEKTRETESLPFLRQRLNLERLESFGIKSEIQLCVDRICNNGYRMSIFNSELLEKSLERPISKELLNCFYYAERWFWIQWPWLSLRTTNAFNYDPASNQKATFEPTSREVSSDYKGAYRYWDTKVSLIKQGRSKQYTCPKSARSISNLHLQTKDHYVKRSDLLLLENAEVRKEQTDEYIDSPKSNMPFAYDTIRSKNAGSKYPSALKLMKEKAKQEQNDLDSIAKDAVHRFGSEQLYLCENVLHPENISNSKKSILNQDIDKLTQMRQLNDKLSFEIKAKERELVTTQQELIDNAFFTENARRSLENAESKIEKKKAYMSQIDNTITKESQITSIYSKVELCLLENDPSKNKKYLKSLEQQITLTRQQLRDFQAKTSDMIVEGERLKKSNKQKLHMCIASIDKKNKELLTKLDLVSNRAQRANFATTLSNKEENAINDDVLSRASSIKKSASVPSFVFSGLLLERKIPLQNEQILTKCSTNPSLKVLNQSKRKLNASKTKPTRLLSANLSALKTVLGSLDSKQIVHEMNIIKQTESKLKANASLLDEKISNLRKEIRKEKIKLGRSKVVESDSCQVDVVDENNYVSETPCNEQIKAVMQVYHMKSNTIQQIKMGMSHIVSLINSITEFASNDTSEGISRGKNDLRLHNLRTGSDLKALYLAEQKIRRLMESSSRRSTIEEPENNESCVKVYVESKAKSEIDFDRKTLHIYNKEDKALAERERGSLDALVDSDKEMLSTFVTEALHTSESQHQQRIANMLTKSNQNKRSSKGLVLETVLDSPKHNNSNAKNNSTNVSDREVIKAFSSKYCDC